MCSLRTTWMCWTTIVCLAVAAYAQQATQPAATDSAAGKSQEGNGSKTGLVKGNNVYVRSGSNANYYPVTKLNKGDEVTVLGQEFGWLKIAPPAGCYSLVDKTYVDKVDDKSGVVNGSIWAYAGSSLNNQKYAKQVKLQKGDKVQVIGETADGALYKIEPPAGATLWVSAELVDRDGTMLTEKSDGNKPAIEPLKPGTLKLEGLEEVTTTTRPAIAIAPPTRRKDRTAPTPAEPKDTGRYQLQIDAIEAEVAAEMAKPMNERKLEPIIMKYEPIASQEEDQVAHIYAVTRMEQLRGHLELVDAVKQIRTLTDTAIENANEIAKQRDKIRVSEPILLDDVVLRGEIWVSGIYDGQGNRAKRWRVVERGTGKTLAYIEVPPGSPIDPVQYYGKFVGVRASGRRQIKNTIPPVPVYTVQEIVVLDPNAPNPGESMSETYSASPAPRSVAVPSSQPAVINATTAPSN